MQTLGMQGGCFDIEIDSKDPKEIIRFCELLSPTLGGINLEDISQPRCFRILDTLRERMRIPVWHDDQQGSATVVLAGLLGANAPVRHPAKRRRVRTVMQELINLAGKLYRRSRYQWLRFGKYCRGFEAFCQVSERLRLASG